MEYQEMIDNNEINKNAPWVNRTNNNYTEVPFFFPSLEYSKTYLDDMQEALDKKVSYVFVRCGDGELCVLQQDTTRDMDYLLKNVPWASSGGIDYCGTSLPNIELRDRMITAYKNADLVGIFKGDPPMDEVFQKIGICPKSICYAFTNIALPMNPIFVNMLLDKKILLIGKNSEQYKTYMEDKINANIVGTIKISSYAEIEKCMSEMEKYDYEIVLACAGVNAKVICYEMSLRKPALYIDLGHALDNASHPKGKYDEYWLIPVWKPNKHFNFEEQVLYNKVLYKCVNQNYTGGEISPDRDNESWIILEILK